MKTAFGWVEMGKVRYDHDIIVHTDRSVTKRSKKKSKELKEAYGHTPLSENELGFLADEKPEVVYIGTGQYGDLPVTPEAYRILSPYMTVIRPTPEILVPLMTEKRAFVAILHVTC